jgi:hypothetical protein
MRRNLVNVDYGRFGPPTNQFQQVNPVLSNVINAQPVFYSVPPLSRPPFQFPPQFPAFPQPQQLQPQTYYSGPPNMPPQPLQSFMQPQILIELPQTSYNNSAMPMPIQQVEEKTIVESMHQNFDGNRNNISFPKSQIDQEFNKAGFSKQHYDIRYNLAQNAYGANSLNFVFVQRQNVFPQHYLPTIQGLNNQKITNYNLNSTPLANLFQVRRGNDGYPTIPENFGAVYVDALESNHPQTPFNLRTEGSIVGRATLAGNTPPEVMESRVRALNLLSPRKLFSDYANHR